MITQKQIVSISKFLSLVLRHQPQLIGIELDKNGWTDVDTLLKKSIGYGVNLDFETLKHIVETNSKRRFAFNDTLDKIRASQGHSVEIELGYSPKQPPEILYHGTGEASVQSILHVGLDKRERQYVHLSANIETAKEVGRRHGKPVVFKVLAGDMFKDKFEFFISDNDVWLTDNVPARYIETLLQTT